MENELLTAQDILKAFDELQSRGASRDSQLVIEKGDVSKRAVEELLQLSALESSAPGAQSEDVDSYYIFSKKYESDEESDDALRGGKGRGALKIPSTARSSINIEEAAAEDSSSDKVRLFIKIGKGISPSNMLRITIDMRFHILRKTPNTESSTGWFAESIELDLWPTSGIFNRLAMHPKAEAETVDYTRAGPGGSFKIGAGASTAIVGATVFPRSQFTAKDRPSHGVFWQMSKRIDTGAAWKWRLLAWKDCKPYDASEKGKLRRFIEMLKSTPEPSTRQGEFEGKAIWSDWEITDDLLPVMLQVTVSIHMRKFNKGFMRFKKPGAVRKAHAVEKARITRKYPLHVLPESAQLGLKQS